MTSVEMALGSLFLTTLSFSVGLCVRNYHRAGAALKPLGRNRVFIRDTAAVEQALSSSPGMAKGIHVCRVDGDALEGGAVTIASANRLDYPLRADAA